MKEPLRCALWKKSTVGLEDLNFESVNVFNKTTHIKRDLFKCRDCGQLYFHEWYEHMDFNHDAYMYDTYIPVETESDIATLLKNKSTADLEKFLPQLHGSHTNDTDDSLHWIRTDADREANIASF
ncbi:hypothetical protein HYV30_01830 [Candidatus Kaiserbacteria bacterium]|nr:hypothetical protein [Candidatus Kaiserbacteria bacterium]